MNHGSLVRGKKCELEISVKEYKCFTYYIFTSSTFVDQKGPPVGSGWKNNELPGPLSYISLSLILFFSLNENTYFL